MGNHHIRIVEVAPEQSIQKNKALLNSKRLVCLDIPDECQQMDPMLIRLLEYRVSEHVPLRKRVQAADADDSMMDADADADADADTDADAYVDADFKDVSAETSELQDLSEPRYTFPQKRADAMVSMAEHLLVTLNKTPTRLSNGDKYQLVVQMDTRSIERIAFLSRSYTATVSLEGMPRRY